MKQKLKFSTLLIFVLIFFMISGILLSQDKEKKRKIFPMQELEITREDEDTGKAIFTIHTLPGKTGKFDKIEYELVYHQEFDFENSRGKKYYKIHEPAKFKYTRRDEKMVADLDHYVNFRAPVSAEQIELMYGNQTFKKNVPINIPRIIIRAYQYDEMLWQYTLEIGKKYIWDDKEKTLKPKS